MAQTLATARRTDGRRGDLVPPGPSGLPMRRRWGKLAFGVGLVVVWTWGTVALVMSAGDRADVLVLARNVGRFEPIEAADLRVARVGVDSDVDTVPAGERDEMVGRVAAVDLVEGSVLSPTQVVSEGERVVGEGEVLIGARLKPGELPGEGVRAGSGVLVVIRPDDVSSDGRVTEVAGWVLSVGEPDDQGTGERSVELVVPREEGPTVSAAAADGRVSLAVVD